MHDWQTGSLFFSSVCLDFSFRDRGLIQSTLKELYIQMGLNNNVCRSACFIGYNLITVETVLIPVIKWRFLKHLFLSHDFDAYLMANLERSP